MKRSKKDEALYDISHYILPVFTFNGEKFVRLEHAQHLIKVAKEALEKKKK